MWLLGIELRTFEEQAMLLTTEPSLLIDHFQSGFDWCETVTVFSGTVRECKLLRVRFFINASNISPASRAVIGS